MTGGNGLNFRSVAPFGLASIFSALAGVALLMVLTRLLGPAEFGRYAVLTSIAGIGQATLFFWIQNGALRLGAEPANLAAPGQLTRTVGRAFAIAAIVAVGIAVGLTTLSPAVGLAAGVATCCYLVARAATGLVQVDTRLRGDARRYVGNEAVLGIGTLAMTVAGLIFFPNRVAIPLAAGALAAVAVIVAHRRTLPLDAPPVPLAALWHYGAPMALVGLTSTILSASDRWIVARFAGDAAAGAYAAAYTVADRGVLFALTAIAGAIRAAVFIAHDGEAPETARTALRGYAIWLMAFGFPAATLLTFGAQPVSRLLIGGGMAAPAAALLPWLAPGTLLAAALTTYFGMAFQIVRRPVLMLAALAPAAAVNLTANVVLVPRYGAVAAGWTTLGSYALAVVAATALGRRHLALPVPIGAAMRLILACAPLALVAQSTALVEAIGPLAMIALAGLAYVSAAALLFPALIAKLGRHS